MKKFSENMENRLLSVDKARKIWYTVLMETQNICLFAPRRSNEESIHTLNFVLETDPNNAAQVHELSAYRLHYILAGKGTLHINEQALHLYSGDLFFGLPAVPYHWETDGDLEYAYVSFLGQRANALIDKFRICASNCVFRGFEDLELIWRNALLMDAEFIDLRSESVLLYTFSDLATKYYPQSKGKTEQAAAAAVKTYIDGHFHEPELSLSDIGEALSYNPKYVSTVFKRAFHLGVSEYLNTMRVQYACTLMEEGMLSVKNVAYLCGFRDPLYFSKVFKKQLGIAPKERIRALHGERP